jgi:predicted alpha/beta superfamily hydrolase
MKFKLICFCLFLTAWTTYGQLTLTLTSVPSNTPINAEIFIAGDFQGWNPGDTNYKLIDNGNGTYSITINPTPGALAYKFTRGSWATVEGNENGTFRPNRTYQYTGNASAENHTVLSWEDLGGGGGNSTAAWNVSVLDNAFPIPELDRERRIWIYLPPDYDTTQKEYPVLYMHDGQNVFDAATSFAGEWEVDESLNELFDQGDYGCIVVAIDNGGTLRLDEYSPWVNMTYGGGEGHQYISFVVNTLKPYIDATYRTLPDRKYTGIMGSSMGGLISLYAGIEWQDMFSKVGSFSPAYWFSDQSYHHVAVTPKEESMKIYTIVGALESNTLKNGVFQMEDSLIEAGFGDEELRQVVHADGQHSEWYWAREFSEAYLWLFGDLGLSSIDAISNPSFEVFPNPAADFIRITGWEQLKNPNVRITSIDGKLMRTISSDISQLNIQHLLPGVYVIELVDEGERAFQSKLVVKR